MKNNIIKMKDGVGVEYNEPVNLSIARELIEKFGYDFFDDLKRMIDEAAKDLKRGEDLKPKIVSSIGWYSCKAMRVQEEIAKSVCGDVYRAHTSKLAEIRIRRIGMAVSTGKDIKDVIKANKQHIKHRASVNSVLSGQMRLDMLGEVESIVPEYINQQYDLTGVIVYHLDDNNNLDTLKLVFLNESGKAPLLTLHAPESLFTKPKDIIEYEDTRVTDTTWEKSEEDSLKKLFVLK